MKRIRKTYQAVVPNGKVLTTKSNSNSDTYSCEYINDKTKISDYSTEETVIGTFLGKPLYRIIRSIGSLPNNTTKSYVLGVSNIDKVIDIRATSTNGTSYISLPSTQLTLANGISISIDKSYIYIATGVDRSKYTETYVTIEYTKTTD